MPDEDLDSEETPEDSGGKTFTQEDLNRISAKEKREGRKLGMREVMEQFGFDSVDDAKAFIEEARERGSKDSDDAAKRLKKIEERERKIAEKERTLTVERNNTKVLAALIGAQIEPKKAARAARMVDLDLSADDLTDDEIAESVTALKEEMPELFGVVETEKKEPWRPAGSTPDSTVRNGKPRKQAGSLSAKERAQQRLIERNPRFAKSS